MLWIPLDTVQGHVLLGDVQPHSSPSATDGPHIQGTLSKEVPTSSDVAPPGRQSTSVTCQIGEKRPYLHAVSAEGPGWDGTQLSAGTPTGGKPYRTHSHFLSRLAHSYGLVTRASLTLPRVVTDYSWALIHAVPRGRRKPTPEDT